MTEPSFVQHVADYFKALPNTWIDGVRLEAIGGRYAWRSRVSDCRRQLGMTIENRQRRLTDSEGKPFVISEYRYVPAEETAPVNGHDINAWGLRG